MWRLGSRSRGQGMAEYSLILTLVSIVVIVILLTMGKEIRNTFKELVYCLSQSSECTTASAYPAPTTCPTVVAPTLTPEVSATPVYTFTQADFGSKQRVLQGSIVRVLFNCNQSGVSYRSVSGTALVPILWGDGYAVFVASAAGDASIEGSLDH